MKKILENFYVIFFIVFIFGILIASTISKDKQFSDYENRSLQMFPEISKEAIFEGDFQNNFDTYTSDQLIFKNYFVKAKNYLDISQLKLEVNGVYRAKDNFYIERHSKDDYDLELLNKNIDFLLNFKNKYNAEIYLVPTANQILQDKLTFNNDFDYNNYMSKIENINYVDNILNSYEGNKDDLFYKTDHHWTTIGAYELYKNIVENPIELNLELIDDSFYGTINNKLNITMEPDKIYKQSSSTNFKINYDMMPKEGNMYEEKHLKTKDKYSYFLDSNHGHISIINEDIASNEKVLIIKDSYANCFVPFMAESYKQVDVIDLRYFNMPMSQYLTMFNYDRIIVLYNKDGFATSEYIFNLK